MAAKVDLKRELPCYTAKRDLPQLVDVPDHCAGQPGCTRSNQPEWCFRNASVRSLNSLTFS